MTCAWWPWTCAATAVITSLELDRPILCGWSYGVVVCDSLSRCGEAAVGGIALVGAVSRLGEPVLPFLGANFLATLPGLFSTDVEASTAALRTFIHLTTSADPAPEDLYLALGYNSVVPPHVRQAMLSRTLSHDGLLERLTIPHAKTSWYQGIGHSPFLEVPDQFNADLRAFASSL